jgi:integrase/recombinase XerD
MSCSLFDRNGIRKYLTARERLAFVYAASKARISETLRLTVSRIDAADEAIIFETLKQRKKQIFHAVPVPRSLIPLLTIYSAGKKDRL